MANAVVCRFPNVPSSNCSLLIACIGSVMCRLRKSLVFRLRIHSRAINAVALVSTKHYKCSVACSKRGILRVCREVEKSMLIIEVKVKKNVVVAAAVVVRTAVPFPPQQNEKCIAQEGTRQQ